VLAHVRARWSRRDCGAESYTFADPLSDTDPITGGTDTFRDVGGEVSFDVQEIEGTDLYNSIYTFRLLRLDDGRR